jgi:hypothetical protein
LIVLRVEGPFSIMALQFDEKSSGTTRLTRPNDKLEDDQDWNPKMDDVEVSSREIAPGTAVSRFEKTDPVTDLKDRLSAWGQFQPIKRQGTADLPDPTYSDPNLPVDKRESSFLDSSLFDDDDVFSIKEVEDSPYPEVRAAVHNYDEDVPANTIRAWVLGMSLVVVGASMNTLFSLRAPSIGLGALIAQIIAWPLGHGWAKVMPTRQYTTFGLKWSLNPGPFNIKEHSIIVVMASVSFSAAYATDILLAQIAFYKQDFGILFQLLLVISTQSVGYGIAGMMRKFLV